MRRQQFPVLTIGHSVHTEQHFTRLVKNFGVDIVLDIRSSPYSRRAPQYNRAAMKQWLADAGVRYSFGGGALGGRPADPSLYVEGRADYERMAQTDEFRRGLRRIATAARSHCVALLCAEADPLECHRFLLVGRALHEAGFKVGHVLPSGNLETHQGAEERLFRSVGLLQASLFEQEEGLRARAYSIQSSRVAYVSFNNQRHDVDVERE